MFSIIFINHLSKFYSSIMNTDSFVLSFSEGNVDHGHMDLSNLEPPVKTNNKVPGKFKHELVSRIIEEFIALSPKTYSLKVYPKKTKEKGLKNCR